MSRDEVIVRFEDVSFEYSHRKPILDEVSFTVRRGSKVTLMGQNGAGKTSLFRLIELANAGKLAMGDDTDDEIPEGGARLEHGRILLSPKITIATARQVIPRDQLDLSVRAFFEKCFDKKIYDIDPRIDKALHAVNLDAPKDRLMKSFSGGQQARLLLASALIQDPDLLLLDEPTNNLDKAGIEHLTKFLKESEKTCIVISHDAEFLNSFTQGVLYLDVHLRKVEQFDGNYNDLLAEITARIEKENRKNAQLAKEIQENKDKANFFANKGGQMRLVAKRMREKAEELEEEIVDIRKEDKTIRSFRIPHQDDLSGDVLTISSYKIIRDHKPVARKTSLRLRKNQHLLLAGPNGIGKTTLLESLASLAHAPGSAEAAAAHGRTEKSLAGLIDATLAPGIRVGYYRQDFSTLNFDDTVYDSLASVMPKLIEETLYATAAQFLITGEMVNTKIGSLSEGQKGLVAFARLVLQKPGLLILDEPTNHINFRHIPVIADALDKYEGTMILVSHVPDFVKQIRIDEILDLSK